MRQATAMSMMVGLIAVPLHAQWAVLDPHDQRTDLPGEGYGVASTIDPGDSWPQDSKFRWMIHDVEIPETIDGQSVKGKPIGLQFNCGDGGAVYVEGELRSRYDNDHPALVILAERAEPGRKVRVQVQVYGMIQGGDKFDEATLVLLDPQRVIRPLKLSVNLQKGKGRVPDGLIGLSQGAGLADYEDATAAKLVEGGFKWFRMDNIFTQVLKQNEHGEYTYDWDGFDERTDFIVGKMKAEPIFAVSYMPQVLDAVDNKDRQSAPKDYGVWEDLCYQAAKRAKSRGTAVQYWEVWNEANAGWIKPGPEDDGDESFKKLYESALGAEAPHDIIRRFEAYAKLYKATARGVTRADKNAKVGGPALASGPFEQSTYGYCVNGKGFARGLMAWCIQENLPLDFVSWHEYFHPAEVMTQQVKAFRSYLKDYPEVEKTVEHYMLTEWNEAWWHDRPQDHELGAAYGADCVTRSFIPDGIDRPCFFYVKQNDMHFRGDWSLLMQNNVPKASYNMCKIFNNLSGEYMATSGGDDEVSMVAALDKSACRLAVVLVNFKYRHNAPRAVELAIDSLPAGLKGGSWREWTIDKTHGNAWHDVKRAELDQTRSGRIDQKSFTYTTTMPSNSIILLELLSK